MARKKDSRIQELVSGYVRAVRESKGLTREQVARMASVISTTIHQVESGDVVPRIDTMLKLAKALELDLNLLRDTYNFEVKPAVPNEVRKKLDKYVEAQEMLERLRVDIERAGCQVPGKK